MALKFLRWVILAALLHPGSSSTSSTDSATSGAIAKPECNGSVEVSFEFASNGAGVRNTTEPLYVVAAERGGCITITEIWNTFGFFSPLFPVDPDSGAFNSEITGTWLLWEDLYVQDGVTLQVCRVYESKTHYHGAVWLNSIKWRFHKQTLNISVGLVERTTRTSGRYSNAHIFLSALSGISSAHW